MRECCYILLIIDHWLHFNSIIQVNFLTKLVALKPGKTVGEIIKNVMLGKDEGADNDVGDQTSADRNSSGIAGRVGFIPDMTYVYFFAIS